MEKKIEDYLHLYGPGTQVLITPIESGSNPYVDKIEALSTDWVSFTDAPDYYFGDTPDEPNECEIKIVLRPLSDMTEEEENKLCSLALNCEDFIITQRSYGYQHNTGVIHSTVRCMKIEEYSEHPKQKGRIPTNLIQIDTEDAEIIRGRFENMGENLVDDVCYNSHEITIYLLSKGFDLFNLIEAGLAINKIK